MREEENSDITYSMSNKKHCIRSRKMENLYPVPEGRIEDIRDFSFLFLIGRGYLFPVQIELVSACQSGFSYGACSHLIHNESQSRIRYHRLTVYVEKETHLGLMFLTLNFTL